MSDFRIGWLFPDTMFLHGDRGNVLALSKYAESLGLDSEVRRIDFETKDFDPADYDVLFMAPGEISSFPEVVEWLTPYGEALSEYIDGGHPLVVTGTSIGVFCDNVVRDGGDTIKGLGILHSDMRERNAVYGDDLYYRTEYRGEGMEIIGNQISMADIILGSEAPFGEIIYGYGNTGKDKKEGIRKGYSIFTNALGPVLVTDPWLTVGIIKAALEAAGKEVPAKDPDFDLERKSFDLKKAYIASKKTELTNA